MAVPTLISQLSQTAALNSPSGSDAPFPDADDFIRADGAFIAVLLDGGHQWVTSISGTDTITGSVSAGLAAYVAGQKFSFVSAGANTGTAPTVNFNSLGAKSITRPDGSSVAVGEIKSGQVVHLVYTGSAMQLMSSTRATTADTATTATSATTATTATSATTAGGSLIGVRVFTSNGTYTPTAGTNTVIVEAVGGGGGGGGCGATSGGQVCIAGGGGSGAYGKAKFTTGFSGVTLTIGAAGTGATAGNNNGGTGGTTSFGALLSCPGGGGGLGGGGNSPAAPYVNMTTAAAAAPTGANLIGLAGTVASYTFAATYGSFSAGQGGSNPLGTGGMTFGANTTAAGGGYGAGGSGSYIGQSTSALAGAAGSPGVIIVYEFA